MPRPKVYPDDLRDRLVDTAAVRLASQGPQELSLRELAASQGTSTNAIYSIFGGKPQLIAAVIESAYASFEAAQHAVVTDHPTMETLFVLGEAYRDWALAHPALYQVMFGAAMTGRQSEVLPEGGSPEAGDDEGGADAAATRRPRSLAAVAEALQRDGLLRSDIDLDDLCLALWSSVHGFVTLEISGTPLLTDAGEQFRRIQEMFLRGLAGARALAA